MFELVDRPGRPLIGVEEFVEGVFIKVRDQQALECALWGLVVLGLAALLGPGLGAAQPSPVAAAAAGGA